MSNKDLQRLTEYASYIGQPSPQRSLHSRRIQITQNICIGRQTPYLSVPDNQTPAEIFLRVKGDACTLEKVGDLLTGAECAPCGAVSRHHYRFVAVRSDGTKGLP